MSSIFEGETLKKVNLLSAVIASAIKVLPVRGGPNSKAPFEGFLNTEYIYVAREYRAGTLHCHLIPHFM